MEGFAWLSTATVLMIPLLPVAVIDDGAVALKDWAMMETVLIGICGPPLFIGSRSTSYDLESEWVLLSRD